MTQDPITITITVCSVLGTPDPSGGPGTQVSVDASPDPLKLTSPSGDSQQIKFVFATDTISRTFTDFRYIRICDAKTLNDGYSVGRWYCPADPWSSFWTAGEMMTGSNVPPGPELIITDRNTKHTAGWTYLYLLEWIEDGDSETKYVCDPKIYQSPSGGLEGLAPKGAMRK